MVILNTIIEFVLFVSNCLLLLGLKKLFGLIDKSNINNKKSNERS